jgi:hypothetical protein
MQTTTKVGHVTFVHDDQFKGDVEISRGDRSVAVPVEALRKIVAEAVRVELLDNIVKMKPEQLLRRIA